MGRAKTDKPAAARGLRPIARRKTVQDLVYDQLREALMSGAFEAQASFTITALSEQFQTSHMPVREALRRLAAEGALRIAPSGTAQVPAITLDELTDLTRARIIIEPATAALAAPHLGKGDLKQLALLREIQEKHGLSGAMREMVATNRAFHFYIYSRAGSPVLLSQIETLWLRSGPYVRLLSDLLMDWLRAEGPSGFVYYHDLMLDALHRGDHDGFCTAIADDIRATVTLLEQHLRENSDITAQ